VRSGRYKLVKPQASKKWELYDLVSDPGEAADLAKENADVAARLMRDLERWSKMVRE